MGLLSQLSLMAGSQNLIENACKRQTTVIPTTSGQLAAQTVSIKKRIPWKRKHSCHLCGEDFDMQSQFTTHMKQTHPNDMFQCEHCDKT